MPKKGQKMSKKVRVIQNRVQKGNKIPNVQQKCVKMTYHASKLAQKGAKSVWSWCQFLSSQPANTRMFIPHPTPPPGEGLPHHTM